MPELTPRNSDEDNAFGPAYLGRQSSSSTVIAPCAGHAEREMASSGVTEKGFPSISLIRGTTTQPSGRGTTPQRLCSPAEPNTTDVPAIDDKPDQVSGANGDGETHRRKRHSTVGRLIKKVPQNIWQANAVVSRDRRTAHVYWALLLTGYVVYVALAIRNGLERRKSPPVQLTRVNKAFQLPDVGFCFEGDTYGSRFACFDGDANGKDCADSYRADAFVYGYNHTGYVTPDGYEPSDDYVVLLPDSLSDTCRRFRLSTLTATDSSAWRFHMLMFWNSQYNRTLNPGAFESIKMYLYDGRLTATELVDTPITLYAPMSFDANEVPFVRGFLEYEQRVLLNEDVENIYKVVDTTQAPWHNAENAVQLSAAYKTDSLASIQLDIRALTYLQYEEIDPVDIVGTLGEISGFWLVVPLLFGLLFYRRPDESEAKAEMRSFKSWRRSLSRSQIQEAR